MKNVATLVILNALFFIQFASAQTSVVQDTKGETSLNLGKEGVIALNAKDESITFSFGANLGSNQNANTSTFYYAGIKAKGKAKNSISNVIKNDDFQFDGSLGFFLSSYKTYQTGPINRIDQFFIGADFLLPRFKLFDKSLPFDQQLRDEAPGGSRFTLGYNRKDVFRNVAYVFGVAISPGQKNNTDELKAITVATFSTDTNRTTGQVRSVRQDEVSAFEVTKYKNNLSSLNINVDFGPSIAKRFLLLFHPRYSILQYREPQFNPAIGLYLNKSGAPLEVVAGFQLQFQDYFNTAKSEKTRGERTLFNIVAGFTF